MVGVGWRMLAAALAYFLAAQLGIYANVGDSLVSSVWPATGVAMALLWLGGLKFWPAIVLGEILSATIGGWSIVATALSAVGNTSDAVIGVLLLRRFGFSGHFSSLADVPRFAASPALACMISATLGVSGLVAAGQAPWSDFGTLWLTWWGSAVAGTLILFPFLTVSVHPDEWVLSPAKLIEVVAFYSSSIAALTLMLLGTSPGDHGHEHGFFILTLLVLVWPAIRLRLCWSSLTALVLIVAVVAATRLDTGPFAFGDRNEALLLLQAFIGTISLVTLVISTTLQERDEAIEAMRRGKETAEEAARAKSAFLASMSHELRTPLNAILGFSEVLSRNDLAPMLSTPQRVAEYGGHIQQAGNSLLSLINDLLDLSKIEAGKLEVVEEDVHLDTVIEECLTTIRHHPSGGSVILSYEAGVINGVLRSDSRRFRQILLNLLSNAAKYTPAGGSVTICTERMDGHFLVRVKDTGIGMTAEQIAKALIPFAQIDNPLTRKNEGTGLGLPLTYQLTQRLGGVLRLESQPSHGTTAIVEFPAEKLRTPLVADAVDVPPSAQTHSEGSPDRGSARELLTVYDQPER